MSYEAQTWAVKQKTGSPARKAVLMNLADRADEAWSCFPGQKRIADDTELGERTVRRALEDLVEVGLVLRAHRRRKDGSYTSDRYVLAGILTDPDAAKLIPEEFASQRPERPVDDAQPAATAAGGPAARVAGGPAATLAGHEPPGSSNHHSSPSPDGEDAREARSPQAAPPRADRKKAATPLPPDWTLSVGARKWTEQRHPQLPIDEEVEKFKDRAIRDDARYRSWDAAWRTWCGNWATWQRQRQERRGTGAYSNEQWRDGSAQKGWSEFMGGAEL